MDQISSLSYIDGNIFESNQVYVYIITIVAVLVWAGSGFFSAWLAGLLVGSINCKVLLRLGWSS